MFLIFDALCKRKAEYNEMLALMSNQWYLGISRLYIEMCGKNTSKILELNGLLWDIQS